jgi:hypothetical protein
MLARCGSCIAVLTVLASCTAARDSGQNGAADAAGHDPAGQSSLTAANVITAVATEYAFQLPAAVPAGLTTLRLVNHGREVHMMGLTKLEGGKSIAELLTILTKGQPQPAWAVDLGGPNAISPGDTSNSTLLLAPGHYTLICWIPSADGSIHFMKGMLLPLEVTAARTAPLPEPAADVTVRLADYRIDLSGPITSGTHTFRVENDGPQEHDVTVLEVMPGKTAADAIAWFTNPAKATPAGWARGGIVGIPRDTHGFFTGTFHRGQYVFLCFVPDEHDGKPHFMRGMERDFSVE